MAWVEAGNHYFILSLRPSPCTHTCRNTHAFLYSTEKQQQLGPGRAPLPQCACLRVTDWERSSKYVWSFGSLFLRREGRCASSSCPPESPVQLELCWPGQQAQPAAGFPRIWHYLKWRWTHLANEHPLPLFLWALFSIGLFFLIRSLCPIVQSGKLAET